MTRSQVLLCSVLSVLLLSPAIRADTIDNFTLVGYGHTVTWSLPDGVLIPQYTTYNSFFESAPGMVDGISGYTVQADYVLVARYAPSIYLTLPESVYGTSTLPLVGPLVTFPSWVYVNDPSLGTRQQYAVAAFKPGNYALQYFPYPPNAPPYVRPGPPIDFTLTINQQTGAATPEPPSLLLLATGGLGFAWLSVRRAQSTRPSGV